MSTATGVPRTVAPRPPRSETWRWTVPATWPRRWPLSVLLLGYPLWWALGLAEVLVILVAVPMAAQLLRRRTIRLPSGFGWWAMFLVAVAASGLLLAVDAPYGVPGGTGGRVPVFLLRLLRYLSCTVILLWVANLDERELPTRKVVRLLGWMFVITVVGGLLGTFAPRLEFTSPVEMLLPGALRSNFLVRSLVHPVAASVQSVTGNELPRPTAPFAFANAWGANLSMFLPFFLVGWFARDAGWRRPAALGVLALAAIPVVYSLNRGLWASLALGVAFVVGRYLVSGRVVAVAAVVLVVGVAGAVFLASPLGDLSSERLANPHSNQRRGELLARTVSSAAEASPVLGFGSTRDVQGSFASIAGGARPDCPSCRVPPLGTQGQLWLVVFAHGFAGTVAYLGFIGTQFARHWRCRSTVETVGVCLLLFATLQMFVYDTLGLPVWTLMLGIGLMWREHAASEPRRRFETLEDLLSFVRRNLRLIGVLVVVGALAGGAVAALEPSTSTARRYVLLSPVPVHAAVDDEGAAPREITIDTEASMVFSERAVRIALRWAGEPPDTDLRSLVRVGAVPNTRVLTIGVSDRDPQRADRLVDAITAAYLRVRDGYLDSRRAQVLQDLRRELVVAGSEVLADDPSVDATTPEGVEHRRELQAAVEQLTAMPTVAGEVLRDEGPKPDRADPEVPVVSGAFLGFAVAVALAAWRESPHRRRSRRRGRTRVTTT